MPDIAETVTASSITEVVEVIVRKHTIRDGDLLLIGVPGLTRDGMDSIVRSWKAAKEDGSIASGSAILVHDASTIPAVSVLNGHDLDQLEHELNAVGSCLDDAGIRTLTEAEAAAIRDEIRSLREDLTPGTKEPIDHTHQPYGVAYETGMGKLLAIADGNDAVKRAAEDGVTYLVRAQKQLSRARIATVDLVTDGAPPESLKAAHEAAERLWTSLPAGVRSFLRYDPHREEGVPRWTAGVYGFGRGDAHTPGEAVDNFLKHAADEAQRIADAGLPDADAVALAFDIRDAYIRRKRGP